MERENQGNKKKRENIVFFSITEVLKTIFIFIYICSCIYVHENVELTLESGVQMGDMKSMYMTNTVNILNFLQVFWVC